MDEGEETTREQWEDAKHPHMQPNLESSEILQVNASINILILP